MDDMAQGHARDAHARSDFDAGSAGMVDLRALWLTFRRRLGLFLSIAAVVLALVVLVTFQMTPKYTATASVMIDPREREVVDMEAVVSGLPPDSATVDTEVEVLRSQALASRVVEDLGLAADAEFNAALREPEGLSGWLGGVKSGLVGAIRSLAPEPEGLEEPSDEQLEEEARSRITNALLETIGVRREGLTYVIDVSATSESPAKAMRIANAFADAYLVDQLEAKYEATRTANDWLEERLAGLRDEVAAKEQAVELYRAQEGLLTSEGNTLTEQQITDLTAQAVLLRADLAERQARLQAVRSRLAEGSTGQDVAEVLDSEVIRELRSQRAEVVRRQADLQTRYGELHPEIQRVRRELADIDSEIEAEVTRIISSLESEVRVARERVNAIESNVAQMRNELAQDNTSLVRLRELEREAQSSRTLYEGMLGRFGQTSQQESLQQADARIVSRASLPTDPSEPNLMLNLGFGLALAGMAGAGAVFVAETFDRGLSTRADVERVLGASCLALIPTVPQAYRKERRVGDYVIDKPFSSYAEALRTLRAGLLHTRGREPNKIVAVSSALPGEGKTASSLALARVSAMMGTKTLIIDGDTRRKMLSAATGYSSDVGLIEVLQGQASLPEALQREEKTGLHVLGQSNAKVSLADVFGLEGTRALIAKLREQYDFVVIDTAPALPVAETRVLSTIVDAVVLLARWRQTPRDVVSSALDSLSQVDAPVAGVVLTQVDLAAESRYGYGYGYGGAYYKQYRKYYTD